MKTRKLRALAIIIAIVAGAGCNPLNKMVKKADEVTYTVTPNPVEMHGDSVNISISGKYPAKYFHKKVVLEATPIMKGSDGNVIKEFKKETLVGEAADAEGTKIGYASGGSFNYTDKIPYDKAMEVSTLELKAVGKIKTKTKEFPDTKIADGTIITPLLVQGDEKALIGKDNFQKIIPKSYNAEIHYLVNSSNVRSSELSDEDIKGLKAFVKEGVEKEWNFKGMNSSGYASPEGELTLNANLSINRAKSASNYVKGELTRSKIAAAKEDGFWNNIGKEEDWDGFKKLMQESEIKDKDLILRILEMYTDLTKREEEIKALAATYVEVADKILPPLRRAQLTLNAEEMAKSDEEIKRLADSAPDSLTVEELLYAATLTDDINKQKAIYTSCTKVYADEWRGYNNVGYINLMQNNLSEAEGSFNTAASKSADNAVVNNNLGVVARWKGDRVKARELYNSATSAGSEVNYNIGIIDIMDGKYPDAVSNFGSQNTFNAALAQLLNGDNAAAERIVDGSPDKDSAWGYYLKAVIGARNSNKDMVLTNLKNAIGKDGSLKEKAKRDLEFRNYKDDVAGL